jgi:short-subunit dehydrogenase
MEISLTGRSAIITGASKGIGLAMATQFATSGADVALVARGREALDAGVAARQGADEGGFHRGDAERRRRQARLRRGVRSARASSTSW